MRLINYINILITPISCGFFIRKRIPKADVVLECADVDRAIDKNGKAYAQILDGFQDELRNSGYACFTVAKRGSRNTKNAYGHVISATTLFEEIFVGICRVLGRIDASDLYAKKCIQIYINLLDSAGAKVVVGIQPNMYLVGAARALGLPVVDLLHGYGIRPGHWVYGFEAFAKADQRYLCTDYICLDKTSKKIIEKSAELSGADVRCWAYLSPVLKMNSARLSPGLERFSEKYHKLFLITLQWRIERFEARYPHVDGRLHPRIEALISHSSENGYGYIIKPHPILLANKEAMISLGRYCFENSNSYLETNSELADLMKMSDGHITIFSSSTREAALLGVRTLLFSSDEKMFSGEDHLFQAEIQHGLAIRVDRYTESEILGLLETLDSSRREIPSDYLSNIFPDAEDASCIIKKIIEKNDEKSE